VVAQVRLLVMRHPQQVRDRGVRVHRAGFLLRAGRA
jgi:hypothetical protein